MNEEFINQDQAESIQYKNNSEFGITENTELTYDLIDQMKEKYKKIYRTTLIDGTEIIWRRLNRKEYKYIMKAFEEIENRGERLMEREEAVCKIATLYPCASIMNEILSSMAGVAPVLSDDIYEKSGFRLSAPEEL